MEDEIRTLENCLELLHGLQTSVAMAIGAKTTLMRLKAYDTNAAELLESDLPSRLFADLIDLAHRLEEMLPEEHCSAETMLQ